MKDITVAVVGGRGVGKTSICSYNYGGEYTCIGRAFSHKIDNYNIYLCDDTDTPLQCDVMVAVYDTTNLDTLRQLDCTIRSLHRYLPTIVVGNKDDLISGILGGHTQHLPFDVDVLYTSTIDGRGMINLISKIIEKGSGPDTPPPRTCNIQ